MLDESSRKLIYWGLVEILYQLRNAVLHSDAHPSNQSIQRVYKQATFSKKCWSFCHFSIRVTMPNKKHYSLTLIFGCGAHKLS